MVYTGKKRREIVFPLGGIGTGSIGLSGNGHLVDWEIFNLPNKGSVNGYTCFAVRAEYPDGKAVTKILQGDWEKDLSGQYGGAREQGYGFGVNFSVLSGLPHFRHVRFDGKFPIATVTFTDENFPGKVILKAFNPFIPLEADLSGIPAAFFEVKIVSPADDIKYTVVLSVKNPFESTVNEKVESDKYTAVKLSYAGKSPDDKDYGDLTAAVACKDGICQEYWYRGRWKDGVSTFWYDFKRGALEDRHYDEPGEEKTRDHCTVGASKTLGRGQSGRFRFVISWNCPNCFCYWKPYLDENGNDILWKNYYATQYADSVESGFFALDHWDSLLRKTERFCRSLHSSTLDPAVIDAVSSTLSVLKSSTVLRLENGMFWGWEGTSEHRGSCYGTCTHVWSYAYALCFLFPELERSLRDMELHYSTEESGRMAFRSRLPVGRPAWTVTPPCLDGQMATLMKIYRDWKLTGNSAWLKENWETIKRVLEFAWDERNDYEWDRDKDGVLEGRQHHTLDMELFGPSSWLEGMYLGALKAAAEMAGFFGEEEKKAEYLRLFENGYRYMKEHLFNGSYFIQKVDLTRKEYTEHFDCPQYWNEEKGQLKYQIGEGCEIDQMLGQWHANLCGLGDLFDPEQRKTALRSMLRNNVKPSLREFENLWRVYALNDEGGAVMCDYPDPEKKPVIPVPYSEECMTGFEYAFAGLLISEGFVEEGLEVVRNVRRRYDGEKRNPWNEVECGSNYARPMSTYALLPIFSGFTFDLPRGRIGFAPIAAGDFKCLWSVGTGWGDFIRTEQSDRIVLAAGGVTLESVSLGQAGQIKRVYADGEPVDFTQDGDVVSFGTRTVKKELRFER